jgi:hypothetical protein
MVKVSVEPEHESKLTEKELLLPALTAVNVNSDKRKLENHLECIIEE